MRGKEGNAARQTAQNQRSEIVQDSERLGILSSQWGYVPYVMDDDLESDYELIKTYDHKCRRCRQIMHIADETEEANLKCPKCGTMNRAETEIMSD